MTFDSRTFVEAWKVGASPVYSSSEATKESTWIQPSISHQSIDPTGSTIINGVYVRTRQPKTVSTIEPDLALELEAWETASDEALILFEAECD